MMLTEEECVEGIQNILYCFDEHEHLSIWVKGKQSEIRASGISYILRSTI